MRQLQLTETARADLKSVRRYSQRTWGSDRTAQYMAALRDTLKGLLTGTVISHHRDDLRHCVFFEADEARILVVRVLHDRMDYQRHLGAGTDQPPDHVHL